MPVTKSWGGETSEGLNIVWSISFLLQALTTGGIPGFIDVVFNLDSKSLQEDNLISQMKIANKKLVFYGDDTWMKLFPGHFARTDGTTSFFVTDYIEVQKKNSIIHFSCKMTGHGHMSRF